ncbi:MAG: tRNA uridine-5-carboxymethylaminomethyl(34) synthesis enzyme MnmG [Pelagimonas sp.]|uniref:tRNA uridine-5-carboxymethylaminomethyl(34) synthesis enzyme MnmG n=1 Tax=Pelagimonas sp. TaxID=2073170 RepID=UPI003D6BB279
MFHVKHQEFDVLVIGGGHAGAEAASAAARYGAKTALITLKKNDLGTMSCNPAIGGLGKGHLVREIDALGGIMGLAADHSGIQFRLLNRRKGPAVQGPRAQADRELYRESVQSQVSKIENLEVIYAEVVDFIKSGDVFSGVELSDGTLVRSRSIVLTSGTFLNGVVHVGDVSHSGGRMGDNASKRLAARIADLGLSQGRLKTGTPPRLDGTTIDWDILDSQPGDDTPTMFSFLSDKPVARQISCGITHTNAKTHQIITENLELSAMYGGHIDGVGPRYCPSIEDKVVRFADKDSHQVFLEPEGLNTSTVYPNGISTSLPISVQHEYVQTLKGLENAKIVQPGYAIEYDYMDPRSLTQHLSVKGVEGLYFAGQINGTTGYEEAGAQGLVAGLNAAAHALGKETVTFSRTDSYIGVMIDDLTTRGVTEPYRMFTSRAEFRLAIRVDNADQRLTPLGKSLGILSERRTTAFDSKMSQLSKAEKQLESAVFTPNQVCELGVKVNLDGVKRSAMQLLSYKDVTFDLLKNSIPDSENIAKDISEQLKKQATYSSYIERQRKDVAAIEKDSKISIPNDFDYTNFSGLSNELRKKLSDARPENLAQMSRMEGVTPAATALVLAKIRQSQKRGVS